MTLSECCYDEYVVVDNEEKGDDENDKDDNDVRSVICKKAKLVR